MNFTDNNIDQMLRQMAKEDGYDARKLWPITDKMLSQDTLPCEQEQPEQIEVQYVREPVAGEHVFGAAVLLVCIAAFAIVVGLVWFFN